MEDLLINLLVGFLKLVYYGFRGVYRVIARMFGALERLGDEELARRRGVRNGSEAPRESGAAKKATPVAKPQLTKRQAAALFTDLIAPTQKLIDRAAARRELAAQRAATLRFVSTLALVEERLAAIIPLLKRAEGQRGTYLRFLGREEALVEIVEAFIEQRRGPLRDLLGDTDALANAAYAPIVEFCRNRGIPLSSDRAATVVGADKLFFLSVDDPSGLAAVVLPAAFGTEIETWPAIAHEIAHDFFRSVDGLGPQLRSVLQIGSDCRVAQVRHGRVDVAEVAKRATAAWMEELFADAFGVMMMGPAYVQTMAASFGSPQDPTRALAMMPADDGKAFEEHPPGHVRVVAGCRLLGLMGYGKIADELENRWRKQHGEPDAVFAPTDQQRWISVPEALVLDRAASVGTALYMTGLPALRGQPLRSIAGLDFGPREHQQALRIAERFGRSQTARVGDARVLVAGAVLATTAAPNRATAIYTLAREAIIGVDSPRMELPSGDAEAGPLGVVDATALREAIILGELLAMPVSRR